MLLQSQYLVSLTYNNKNLLKQKCKKINKIIYNLWDNSSGNVYSMLAEMTNLIKIKAQIKNLIGLIGDQANKDE